jgi:hypothetical protein
LIIVMRTADGVWQLDDEEREWIGNLLRKEGVAIAPPARTKLVSSIEKAINDSLGPSGTSRLTVRDKRDRLRRLLSRAREGPAAAASLRKSLERLPAEIASWIQFRADLTIPKLDPLANRPVRCPGVPKDSGSVRSLENWCWTPGTDFLEWTRRASDEMVITAVRAIISEGWEPVPGRLRPDAKQSRPHVEPKVLGVVASGSASDVGGRPSRAADRLLFIGNLDQAWTIATGKEPEPSRSGVSAFGDLVHQVYSWMKKRGAQNGLRDYWYARKLHDETS